MADDASNPLAAALAAAVAPAGEDKQVGATSCTSAPGQPKIKKNPCAGVGMADGATRKEFIGSFRKLQHDWAKLPPKDREVGLNKCINNALAKSGSPNVNVSAVPLSAGRNGELDFTTWTVKVNDTLTDSDSLTEIGAKKLANTMYHETRHAEQWFLIAQKLAAEGKSSTEIQKQTRMPASIADSAVKNPLRKNDPRQMCADTLYASIYG